MPRKKCVKTECQKRAQGKTTLCIAHGGGERCAHLDCQKSAQGKTTLCIAHGGGERCVHPDCQKSARGKTTLCVEHGGGERCVHLGCQKGARWKTTMCVEHGGGERCVHPGCQKSAIGNTTLCKAHGGGERCVHLGCQKSAQGNTTLCIKHGGGERCVHLGCQKSAQGNTTLCIEHGGGERCPHCVSWPDSRCGQKSYDGYCATCFKHIFPEDPRSRVIYTHTKEIRVRNAINEHFEGFIHDKPLYTGHCDCTMRRRIDHRKLIGATLLCVETDEFAHRGYDPLDEEIRYDDLYMVYSGKWIFIRFNPDGKGVDMEDKLTRLIEEIQIQIGRIENENNAEPLEVIKLFY
jgi:hypothetical protein